MGSVFTFDVFTLTSSLLTLTCLMSPLLIASHVLTCDMTIRYTNHVDGIGVEIRSANHDIKSDSNVFTFDVDLSYESSSDSFSCVDL